MLKYGALLLTIILLLFPIYWMVICSLMPTHYLTVLPPHFVPVDITLDNYIQIAETPKYVAYFRNSVISGTPPARPPMMVLPRRSSQRKGPSLRPTRNEPSRRVSWAKITGGSSLPCWAT